MFEDVETAPLDDKVKAALRFIEKLVLRPEAMTKADVDEARAAGLGDDAIRDAGLVASMFSIITRLADSLDFTMPESWDGAAKSLTSKVGYRMPPPVLRLPRN